MLFPPSCNSSAHGRQRRGAQSATVLVQPTVPTPSSGEVVSGGGAGHLAASAGRAIQHPKTIVSHRTAWTSVTFATDECDSRAVRHPSPGARPRRRWCITRRWWGSGGIEKSARRAAPSNRSRAGMPAPHKTISRSFAGGTGVCPSRAWRASVRGCGWHRRKTRPTLCLCSGAGQW